MSGSAREYDLATRAVAAALEVELVELADWNCCGGVSAASLSERAWASLCERNLRQVPAEAPELLCPCPHCYTSFARTLASAPEGSEFSAVRLRSVLDVFASEAMLSRLCEKRVEPLTDLAMVAYYGCKLARPDPEVEVVAGAMGSGEAGAAGPLERIIEACGARPLEWSAAEECCGAALGVARAEAAEELLGRIYRSALEAEAEAIVVVCPLCHLNLDLQQYQVSQRLRRGVDIPVFFVTELMAAALGIEECEDWLERHVTSPLSMFIRFFEAQDEREYWGQEGGPPGEPQTGEPQAEEVQAPASTAQGTAANGPEGASQDAVSEMSPGEFPEEGERRG